MSVLVKMHSDHEGRRVIVLYDAALKHTKLEEAGKVIDLSAPYYQDAKEEEQLSSLIDEAVFIQAIGDEAVKLINAKAEAKFIKNIPYAFLVKG